MQKHGKIVAAVQLLNDFFSFLLRKDPKEEDR